MGEPIQQHRGHLGVAEHAGPHSAKSALVVIITLVCSYSVLDRWKGNAPPAWLNGRQMRPLLPPKVVLVRKNAEK
jgi:hypothetical protein